MLVRMSPDKEWEQEGSWVNIAWMSSRLGCMLVRTSPDKEWEQEGSWVTLDGCRVG